MRARELGITVGTGRPGPQNAITDVAGVRVGHATVVRGDDVRTGVTVVFPSAVDPDTEPVFAGCHRLNGNGELTGLEWVRESGMLTSPVAITNTYSVGWSATRWSRPAAPPGCRWSARPGTAP